MLDKILSQFRYIQKKAPYFGALNETQFIVHIFLITIHIV